MPIIKSAKKRVRQTSKASARNARTKRALKTSVKDLRKKFSAEAYQKAQSSIDTSVKKGVMHKNKAARKKRQLVAEAKAAGVKTGAKKTAIKKSTPKKTAAKKPASEKTTPKKTTATKKPVKS